MIEAFFRRFRWPRRLIAAIFMLVASGFMIAAAGDFRPENQQQLVDSAALKMILGGLAIGAAVRASTRLPALGRPQDAPLGSARRVWWLPVMVGALLLLAVAENDVRVFHVRALPQFSNLLQYGMVISGILLVGYGCAGMPSLRPRLRDVRIDGSIVLPLGAILALALFLRLWDQGVTQRYLLDELHFSDTILALESHPTVPILKPMSDESPYTWVYTIWQTETVSILGHNFVGFRFTAAIIGTLTVLAAFGLAREIFDPKTALLAALVLATFPPHVHFSRTAIIQIVDPFFGTMALMFVVRAMRNNRRVEWALAGIALGMTQYFYEGARLLFPPLVIGFVILVSLRGGMRGKWRGFLITLAAAAILALPVYYILVGAQHTLFGRYDVSGVGTSYWQNLAADGISADDLAQIARQMLTPFQIFVTHPDMSVYYGGQQALVLEYLVPFFLIGCFYLAWRYPAPAFIVPLWIVATGLGNGLLRDTLVSSRYEEVLPALALAIAAGVRYLLPFFWLDPPEGAREPQLRRAIPVLAVGAIATAQVGYYFGAHLPYFTSQVREAKPYRDGIDAVLRAADLPGNTQIFLVSYPENDQVVARNWLSFLSRDNPSSLFFPLLAVTPDTISPKFLLSLADGVNYAFFVDPADIYAIAQIYRYFPNVEPPRYSTWDIPADKEYLLFFVPSETIPPRHRLGS